MKILIISTFFPPLNSIASLRPYSWAKYWSQAGHDVTVLTTEKNKDADDALSLHLNGFKIVEVPYPELIKRLKQDYNSDKKNERKSDQPAPRNFLKKLLTKFFHYLRFDKGVFHSCRMPDITDLWVNRAYKSIKSEGPWDSIISTSGPYTTHLIAHKLKKNDLSKIWIADYRDSWSNNFIYKGIFPFNFIERLVEKHILQKADLVTTISKPFAEMIAKEFNHPNVQVIENGFDIEELENISKSSIFPDDDMFRIVHTGSIYKGRRDPSPLFQAIQKIANDPQNSHWLNRLEVIFAGSNQADLQKLIEQYQVQKWVKIIGQIKHEDALRMQRDAHLLLFLPWNDLSINGVLTGKLFEYLFSGTPLLAVGASALEDSQKLIIDSNAGQALFSVESIKKFLIEHLQKNMKVKHPIAAEVLNKYTRKHQADRLLQLLK